MTDDKDDTTVSIEIIFEPNHLTFTTSEPCDFKLNDLHEPLKISDKKIILKFKPHEYDAKEPNRPIIGENMFTGKGDEIFPIPGFKKQIDNCVVRYKNLLPVDLIISGLNPIKSKDTFEESGPIFTPFRRFYGIGLLTNKKKHAVQVLFVNPLIYSEQSSKKKYDDIDWTKMRKNVYKFLTQCNKFFGFDNKKKTDIILFVYLCPNKKTAGGRAGILGGVWIHYDPLYEYSVWSIRKRIIYHETYHQYNPGFGTIKKNEDLLWFNEGFCEYFYRFIRKPSHMKQSIIRKIKKYVGFFSESTNEYAGKYKHNLSKQQKIGEKEEKDQIQHQKKIRLMLYPYYQGFCYAHYLYIKTESDFVNKYKSIIVGFQQGGPRMDNTQVGEYFDKESFYKYIINNEKIPISSD